MVNDLKKFLAELTDAQLRLIDGAASEPCINTREQKLRQKILQRSIRAEWKQRAENFGRQRDEYQE